jgi:hypothetical protein
MEDKKETIFYIEDKSYVIKQTNDYSYEDISRHGSECMAYIINGKSYLSYSIFNTYDEAKERLIDIIFKKIKELNNKIYELNEITNKL